MWKFSLAGNYASWEMNALFSHAHCAQLDSNYSLMALNSVYHFVKVRVYTYFIFCYWLFLFKSEIIMGK